MIISRAWFGALITALYVLLAIAAIATSVAAADIAPQNAKATAESYQPKSKAELRRELTRMQYHVTQEEGTEPAFKNAYWNHYREGRYHCVVCDLPLFASETKFKSGTGWPSFWQPIGDEAVETKRDWKMLYPRTEVHCQRCKAHLGHVFDDGPRPTGLRYCMNSASLKFVPRQAGDSEGSARPAVGSPVASR